MIQGLLALPLQTRYEHGKIPNTTERYAFPPEPSGRGRLSVRVLVSAASFAKSLCLEVNKFEPK